MANWSWVLCPFWSFGWSHVSVSCGLSDPALSHLTANFLQADVCLCGRKVTQLCLAAGTCDQLSPLQSFLSSQKIKPGTVRIFRGHSPSSCFLSTSAKPHRMHITCWGNRKAESIRKRSANLSLQLNPISRIVNKKGLYFAEWSTAIKYISNERFQHFANILPLPSAVYQEGGYSHSRWHRSLTGGPWDVAHWTGRPMRSWISSAVQMWYVGEYLGELKNTRSQMILLLVSIFTTLPKSLKEQVNTLLLSAWWGLDARRPWTHWSASKLPENSGATRRCSFDCASVVDTCWHHYLSV